MMVEPHEHETRPRSVPRRLRVVILAAVLLGSAGIALAAGGEQIKLNAADQAAARAAVIRRADLGTASGWTGGPAKPNLSPAPTCPNFHPKQSDLVLTGAAEADFRNTSGLEFDSEVQVFGTARMVTLDWQRTVLSPNAIPCLRSHIVKGLGSGSKLVSFTRIVLPRLATYTTGFRVVIDVTSKKGTTSVMLEPVLIGTGRTEITLTAIAPTSAQASVSAAAVRLARLLVLRAHA
jgi:hypothetical protein